MLRRRPIIVAPRGRPSLLGTMATTAVVAGTATAVSGAVAGRQHAKAQAQQEAAMAEQAAMQSQQTKTQLQAQPAAAPTARDDMMAKLQQLAQLKEQGLLTDEEFAAAKAKLLQ